GYGNTPIGIAPWKSEAALGRSPACAASDTGYLVICFAPQQGSSNRPERPAGKPPLADLRSSLSSRTLPGSTQPDLMDSRTGYSPKSSCRGGRAAESRTIYSF